MRNKLLIFTIVFNVFYSVNGQEQKSLKQTLQKAINYSKDIMSNRIDIDSSSVRINSYSGFNFFNLDSVIMNDSSVKLTMYKSKLSDVDIIKVRQIKQDLVLKFYFTKCQDYWYGVCFHDYMMIHGVFVYDINNRDMYFFQTIKQPHEINIEMPLDDNFGAILSLDSRMKVKFKMDKFFDTKYNFIFQIFYEGDKVVEEKKWFVDMYFRDMNLKELEFEDLRYFLDNYTGSAYIGKVPLKRIRLDHYPYWFRCYRWPKL